MKAVQDLRRDMLLEMIKSKVSTHSLTIPVAVFGMMMYAALLSRQIERKG